MTTAPPAPTAPVTLIRFCLRLDSPGGVTVPGANRRDEVDAVLDTDHLGRPHVPATSLAGCLRQAVRDACGPDRAEELFGHLNDRDTSSAGVDAVASRIWVHGSRLVGEHGQELTAIEDVTVLHRVSTAIDRTRAAARVHTLREEQLLPTGTRFEVYLRWPGATAAERDELLAVIAQWRPLLGRGVTRGHGRCSIENLHWGALDLTDSQDLLLWVTHGGPELFTHVATHRPANLPTSGGGDLGDGSDVLLRIPFRLDGPMLVGNGQDQETDRGDGETVKVAQPLTEAGLHVIPGSALKGVLRSRCEYVLRSIAGEDAACLDQRCGHCLPCQIFGHGGGKAEGSRAVGRRARIRVADATITEPVTRDRTHVAISRFTGGAEPGLLFTNHVVEAGAFDLTIEDLHLPAELTEPLRNLLRLVLADLDDGLIGIGRATTRGYGSVRAGLSTAEAAGRLPHLNVARAWLATLATDAASAQESR